MRLLANPIVIRMALGILLSGAAFVFGVLFMRFLRREVVEGDSLSENLGDGGQYAYSAVIQQLKQQKFELQHEHSTQRRRAKTSEYISAAVLANLPCGVLFLGTNGLVKQANAAAKTLLGFASPLGMNVDDLFREAAARSDSGDALRFAEVLQKSARERQRGSFLVDYETACGERRDLNVSVIPLALPPDDILGIACVIADETAVSKVREAQLVHKELSAEMALELRTSLSAIRDCAMRMITTSDRDISATLANDISQEIERLEKVVGFLAGNAEDRAFVAHA